MLQHLDAQFPNVGINETAQQLAFADLIMLNKTDLVSEADLEVVKAAVRKINQSAKLLECRLTQEGGRPALSDLLEANAFSVRKALQVRQAAAAHDSSSKVSCKDVTCVRAMP